MRSRPAASTVTTAIQPLPRVTARGALAGGQRTSGGSDARRAQRREADDKQGDDCYHPDDQRHGQRGHQPPELAQAARFRKILVARGRLSPMSEPFRQLRVTLGPAPGERLDKALAAAVPEGLALSRSRLQALILDGAVAAADGTVLADPRLRLAPGTEVVVTLPRAGGRSPPRPRRSRSTSSTRTPI